MLSKSMQPHNLLRELVQDSEAERAHTLDYFKVLETMYFTRFMDEKMEKLVRQNKGGTFHMNATGHEMVGAVAALSLKRGTDWSFPYYRDRAFALGIGSSPVELFGTFLGRATENHSSGRMMPEHFSHKALRIPVQSSVVGSQFLHAVGLAKGLKLSGKNEIVYVSAGDGATSQGDFHEALNFASIHKLSVIFCIQDNGWAISVPISEQTAGGTIVKMARGYEGLSVFDVDGCHYEEVSKAFSEAVEKGRSFEGPSLIVAKVPRLGPHSSSDDPKKYKDDETIQIEKTKDPVAAFENWLQDMGLLTENEIELFRLKVRDQVEESSKAAELIPHPDKDSYKEHVFKSFDLTQSGSKHETKESIVMVDALNHAILEEMERDSGVVVFGQDVAHGKGGVFGVTRDLTKLFGVDRCFNTPLAESTIIGIAIGMSFDGVHKPVAEIQFADYLWTGINQLFNELASIHYRSNGVWNCPVVIRMPTGGYIQGGPYHSQSIEGFLAHSPGLKVVIPSNAADAKMMMKAAILDPNPVVFLEHKALYRQRAFCARLETGEDEYLELGKANVLREGKDLTVITWGMTAVMTFEIAEKLAVEGFDIEVIDIRSIVPLDIDTLLKSCKKTGKVLIAHEAPKSCGFGAEIAARVVESVFHYLDAPIMRIGSFECAVPYSKVLEDEVLPQKSTIEKAIRDLAAY